MIKFSKLYTKCSIRYNLNVLRRRNMLVNKKFTLLTPNCMAGLIYHELGLEFLSPTINLQIFPFDKFVINIREYVNKELFFIEAQKPFPVAKLGDDITIWFTHYHSEEEARKKWFERIKRIQWDNIYILCSDIEVKGREKIQHLIENAECKSIRIFTASDIDLKETVHVKKYQSKKNVGNLLAIDLVHAKREYDEAFDIVSWLNGEDN